MAFGDPIEGASCLLPGGSRVEALEVDNLPAQSRHSSETAELDEADARMTKLPSWLRTDPVKLVPLKKLIREREMVHELSEGKLSDKLYKAEHEKEGPSPHELAMRSVHTMAQKKQQLASRSPSHHVFHAPRSASEKAAEDNFDQAQAAAVRHALNVAQEKARGKLLEKHTREAHHAVAADHAAGTRVETIQHAHAGRTAHVVLNDKLAKELSTDRRRLAILEKDETKEIAAIQKHELHELAQLKYKDHIKEMKLKTEIRALVNEEKRDEQQQRHEAEPTAVSEKTKIKAEMARIEEEEAKKLSSLKAKLAKVQSSAEQATTHPVLKAKDQAGTSKGAVTKLAVPSSHSARQSELAEDDQKSGCNKDNCDLDHEDKKWLAHRKSVDYYAHLAVAGHGAQKAEAIKKMQQLQAQITHDFHHVTNFAVAQEHALPAASSS